MYSGSRYHIDTILGRYHIPHSSEFRRDGHIRRQSFLVAGWTHQGPHCVARAWQGDTEWLHMEKSTRWQNVTEGTGPGFGSQSPHAGSQPSVSPVPGDVTPCSDLHEHQTCMWYIFKLNIHTHKTNSKQCDANWKVSSKTSLNFWVVGSIGSKEHIKIFINEFKSSQTTQPCW